MINKDSSKVTDNVNDTKHEALTGEHGKVGSLVIAGNFATGVRSRRIVSVDRGTFVGCIVDRICQQLVNLVRRVHLHVDNVNHNDKDKVDGNSVKVGGDEGGLETSRGSVKDHTPGDEESSKTVVHAGKGLGGSSTTEQKHRCNDHVGREVKEEEGGVS